MKKKKIHAQPPLETSPIKILAPQKVAGGIKAVVVAGQHVWKEMSLKRCVSTLFQVNQMHGFDCPGCAWPDDDKHRSSLGEYCENGAKAIAEEATIKRVTPDFFKKHTIAELSEKSDFWLGKRGRLTHPMMLKEGAEHYEKISWESAFQHIGKELNSLETPDEAIFYTSGRTSNEAAFLYQLFVRQFGTNNLPDCSNMCHESSGVGLSRTVGIGKGSVKLEDFYVTDLIIIAGQNPGTNHPRMLKALQVAKRNGAKIITINPIPEAGLIQFSDPQQVRDVLTGGTKLTDLYLKVRIGMDVALLKAIIGLLAEADAKDRSVFDHDFIQKHCVGYEELMADIQQYNPAELAEVCGISMDEVREAAEMIKAAKTMIICWAMGLTQHKNGVDNITEVVNLLLLKGSIGKVGAGTCPVRGHSNVQGDRTMGIWEKPKPAFLDKLQTVFDFEPPRENGLNVVEAIEEMLVKKGKVFFAMGGNFLSATPDTELTAKALQNCSLTVQVSTKLNRSHLIHGKTAIILPCLGRTEHDVQASGEQFVTVENSMGVVHMSKGGLPPASEHLWSEPKIVAGLAKATLGTKSTTDWDSLVANYDNTRDKIEAVINGFESYNERVRESGGFYLPNCARDGSFNTLSGKAHFTVNPIPKFDLKADEYLMMTIRSHDQFNTTIYGLDDRYRGIYNGRRVVFMNVEDAKAANFSKGQSVDLFNYFGGDERVAKDFKVVPFDIPKGCVATYFPEANVLVPLRSKAKWSHTPASKSVVIKMTLSEIK